MPSCGGAGALGAAQRSLPSSHWVTVVPFVPRCVSGVRWKAPGSMAVLTQTGHRGSRGGPGCAPGTGCRSWDGRLQAPDPRLPTALAPAASFI